MKAFVTGGTGFIGERVVGKLVARGDEVYALARSEKGQAAMRALGAHPVPGDINDAGSMREAMRGSDVVFHIAGWYKLGASDQQQAEKINVEGTRSVMTLAQELAIPKIIYTSSLAVNGDTQGQVFDETHIPTPGPFLTEYDRTKWKAHYEVALPMIAQGAPVVIVMPGGVYGPGDPSLVGQLMRAFVRGMFPVLPGPEFALTYAYVDDIAEGLLLAADKGRVGESYILAGPVLTMGEAFKLWSKVTGERAPFFSIPARLLTPFAPLMGSLGRVIPLPEILSRDAVAILEASYLGRSDKAERELGWKHRPMEEGLRETFASFANSEQLVPVSTRQQVARLAIGAGLVLLVAWLVTRRRK